MAKTKEGTSSWYKKTQKNKDRIAGAERGKRLMKLFYSAARQRLSVEHPGELKHFDSSQGYRVGNIMNLFYKYLIAHEMEFKGDLSNAAIVSVVRIPNKDVIRYIAWANNLTDYVSSERYVTSVLQGYLSNMIDDLCEIKYQGDK
jgi:hypothetical protein